MMGGLQSAAGFPQLASQTVCLRTPHPSTNTPDRQCDGSCQPPEEGQHVKHGLKQAPSSAAVHGQVL